MKCITTGDPVDREVQFPASNQQGLAQVLSFSLLDLMLLCCRSQHMKSFIELPFSVHRQKSCEYLCKAFGMACSLAMTRSTNVFCFLIIYFLTKRHKLHPKMHYIPIMHRSELYLYYNAFNTFVEK